MTSNAPPNVETAEDAVAFGGVRTSILLVFSWSSRRSKWHKELSETYRE
jgi:hypothetical protein